MTHFQIQIISDSVCPWCYIGYRRLTRAIAAHTTAHPLDTFSLTWQAFYLNPDAAPYPGVDKVSHYNARFGAARTQAMWARLAAIGEAEGIAFKFGGNTGNTRDSHRLIWLAGEKQQQQQARSGMWLQTALVEMLFGAYFEEEKNITDRKVLVEEGEKAGVGTAEELEAFLSDAADKAGREVDAEAEKARRRFVSGVPYFTVQGRFGIEGADEPETFLEVFERVKVETET